MDRADTPPASTDPTLPRRVGMAVFILLSAFLMLAAVTAGWMKLQLLDTDTWVATSQEALAQPEVQEALATRLVDTAYDAAQPEQRLTDALPPDLDPLAGPASAALRPAAYDAAERALAGEPLSQAWGTINRAAHERLLAVVDGSAPVVSSTGSEVTLDLRALVNGIAARIGVGPFEGDRIPEDVTTVTLPRSEEVARSIELLRLLDRLAVVLAVLAVAALAAGIWIVPGARRRALMLWGGGLVVAGLVLHVAITMGRGWVPETLAETPMWRKAIAATYDTATVQLGLSANALILVGIVVLAGTWLLGRSRPALSIRAAVAPVLRERQVASWIVFAVVLLVAMQFVPALSSRTPAGALLVVLLAIVGFAVLRREVVRTTPVGLEVGAGGRAPAAPTPRSRDERLARLDQLHASRVLDDEEYEVARRSLTERSTTAEPAAAHEEPVAPSSTRLDE